MDKLRDLELGNEVRKVLARMLFKVLDEVCQHESHGLCHAQQAFVTGRDIIRNTIMLCRNFFGPLTKGLLKAMILICSSPLIAAKVIIASITASTPPDILAIVESLLINMPVLFLDCVEFAPLELVSGLTHSCPASCMLYIIGVDPLLSSLQQTPHISGVSGFVDDWVHGPWLACHICSFKSDPRL